jgi:hypothetical protein
VLVRVRSHLARGGESQCGPAPAERTRSWFGTAVTPALIIVVVVNLAVPKPEWRSLTFYAPPVRILGLVILLAATAFTIWARLALGTMWSGAPAVKQEHQLRTSERDRGHQQPRQANPGQQAHRAPGGRLLD